MYVVAGHYRESLVTAYRGLVDAVLAMVLKVTKARLSCLKMWVSPYKRLLNCHVDPEVREVKQALVPRTISAPRAHQTEARDGAHTRTASLALLQAKIPAVRQGLSLSFSSSR